MRLTADTSVRPPHDSDNQQSRTPSYRIDELKAEYDCLGNPYNESPKHWIGINPHTAPDDLLRNLTRNSYEIVKQKYSKRNKQRA